MAVSLPLKVAGQGHQQDVAVCLRAFSSSGKRLG